MSKIALNLGEYDEETRSVRVVASTPNPVDGEALVSWDLERFAKNPIVLWAHDTGSLPVGRAEDIEQTPQGLSMRIVLASERANPMAGYIGHLLKEKILRGVSVGFEPGEMRNELREGQSVQVRSANELLEVSFVPVPKDEDAGTGALRMDAGELRHTEERFDARLSKVEFTPWGTARIPTRISRVGVLDYPGRRELRPASEVLKPSSVATLRGVPVIDIVHHTDFVRPKDFKEKVLGFVEEVHVDGDFIDGTLHIHDEATIEAIRRGERLDVSAGYHAPTVKRSGEWRGERYDFEQRDITYNHVALCPPGRGRAGPEVGMKLDSRRSEKMEKFIRLDGKDFEYGSQAHFEKIEAMHREEVAKLQKQLDEKSGRLDAAEAAVGVAEASLEEEKKKAEEVIKTSAKEMEDKIRTKVRSILRAIRFFEDMDGKDDDEKMDALCSLSERDLHIKAITTIDPDFKADGHNDGYIRGRAEGAFEYLAKSRSVDGAALVLSGFSADKKLDAADKPTTGRSEHPVTKARRENLERMRKMAVEGGAK